MRLLWIFTLLLLSLPTASSAQGDPDRGAEIGYTCTGCHGIPFYKNVYPTYTVPKLGGQNYQYIVDSLKAYRSGERQHPTMQAQANTLSEQDMADIAAWLVQLTEEES